MLIDEIQASLFDGQQHPLAESMARWLVSSRRYAAFVAANHTKIRKKLRSTQEPESTLDLRLELETPYLLLRERTLNVTYEPHYREAGRSPDFAVSYTTSLTFMVEVTRVRAAQSMIGPDALATPSSETMDLILRAGESLTDAVCSKLGQLLPQRSNVLVVGMDAMRLTEQNLRDFMLRLQQRAERNDAAVWQRNGLVDRADFFQKYQRLSEIIVRDADLQTGRPAIVWVNPQAKHPLPGKVLTALYRSHAM